MIVKVSRSRSDFDGRALGRIAESLRRDFRVRTSASPGKEPDSTAHAAGFGGKPLLPFTWFDRTSSCWRTSQRSLFEAWTPFSGRWPRAGMTRSGVAYVTEIWVPRSRLNTSGLWPGPRACSAMAARISEHADADRFPNLETVLLKRHGNLARGGHVNPEFCEELMGFPVGWTACELSATPLCPRSPSGSAGE